MSLKTGQHLVVDPGAHRDFHVFFEHTQCGSLGTLDDVAINSERHARIRMTQDRRYGPQIDPGADKHGCRRVPGAMEARRREPRFFSQTGEGVRRGLGRYSATEFVGEDRLGKVKGVTWACKELIGGLLRALLAERYVSRCSYRNDSDTVGLS
jgi:hypothetical protein